MAKISEIREGNTVGVWASAGGATAGLVAVEGTGPYVCFYGKGQSFPGLAIFVNKDGDAMLQLAGPGGKMNGYRQVKIADLIDACPCKGGDSEPFSAAAPPEVI